MSIVYDSLGIISLFLILAKILQQKLWKDGCDWDKAISGQNGNAIKDLVQESQPLGTVGLNRLISGSAHEDTTELHVFCDALLEATAAVAYIKTTRNKETTSPFLIGKTRVATFIQTTVSRLEGQAAV